MISWNFPRIFRHGKVDTVSGTQAAIVDFSLLIRSELFEFRYDPGYGSNVPTLLYRPANTVTEELLKDAFCDLQMFAPNVIFTRDKIQIKKTEPAVWQVTIPVYIDNANYASDLHLYVEAKS